MSLFVSEGACMQSRIGSERGHDDISLYFVDCQAI